MPVVPNAALGGPGDQPWKRSVDGRLDAIERQMDRSALDGKATDKGLAATVASLSEAVLLVKEQQAALAVQQTALAAAQGQIAGQVAFLQSQTSYDSRSTLTGGDTTISSTTWRPFDPVYDCSLTVNTTGSGLLVVQVSAFLGGGVLDALLGTEVVGIMSPEAIGPRSCSVTDATTTIARAMVISVPANSAVTIRLRRGIGGTGTGVALWGYQSLAVTRIY
ncbi:hypothetical protein [Microbacterium sp. zg-YB36]|uniref:hypothetical protein n=1 Tax=Microbacterium sp. zg-YB36 TaxID=2969407 RepID=UPI00214B81E1|nr:hypothetical protein [Microbacterium sp. zg-YB36]MDL5351106.1 hypothetical protein [Microbacterium sp. zg-YB36]